jgi:hypothetical protein
LDLAIVSDKDASPRAGLFGKFAIKCLEDVKVKREGKIKPLRPKKWTESELHRLRALAKKKVTADIVAELLDRHVGSVKRKAREIGLILSKNMKSSQAGPLRPK